MAGLLPLVTSSWWSLSGFGVHKMSIPYTQNPISGTVFHLVQNKIVFRDFAWCRYGSIHFAYARQFGPYNRERVMVYVLDS